MKFLKTAYAETADFWNDLFTGANLTPGILLEDQKQIHELNAAIELLKTYKSELENQGIVESE